MAVEARFKVTKRIEYAKFEGQDHRQVDIALEPVQSNTYDEDGVGDNGNSDWARWTPSGHIEMTIMNDAASDQFDIDQEFRVVFTKHQPQKARNADTHTDSGSTGEVSVDYGV